MDDLLAGYRRFRAEVWPAERARYQTLAAGQRPQTLVVACSDSRVDPQTVFGARPGELFVVRNVAGLVPPYEPDAHYHGTSAALEYGVRVLKVSQIAVLGHADCGGVKALVEGAPLEARDFVEPWMRIAEPVLRSHALTQDSPESHEEYEEEVVRLALANLAAYPWVAEAVAAGQLTLQGFRFAISSGILTKLENGRFVPVL
jgi:carbonic anhydrase